MHLHSFFCKFGHEFLGHWKHLFSEIKKISEKKLQIQLSLSSFSYAPDGHFLHYPS